VKLGMKMEKGKEKEADRLEFIEEPKQFTSIASSIGAKNLLIIIVTMPFVFLVVVMAIIAVFGNPNDKAGRLADEATPGAVRSTPVASLEEPAQGARRVTMPISASAEDLASAIVLPEGTAAGAIALDGDRLALRVDSVDGGMIIIYDLASDEVVKSIPLVSENNQ
jgi:hypothetical protein